jgi:hypothetical protein
MSSRHPSYCKLVAVAEALSRGYKLVAFMDSDAFFRNVSLPLPALLEAYADNRKLSRPPWDVSFASDRPFSLGPNAGVHFWRNTPSARRLLALWWHLPGGRYHAEHDFEQHTLQWALLHLRAHAKQIATLNLRSMASNLDARGWPRYDDPIAHVDHGRNFFRLLLMSCALLEAMGEPVELPPSADLRSVEQWYRTAQLRKKLLRQAVHRLPRQRERVQYAVEGARGRSSVESMRRRDCLHVEEFNPTLRARALLCYEVVRLEAEAEGERSSSGARQEKAALADSSHAGSVHAADGASPTTVAHTMQSSAEAFGRQTDAT